MLAALKTMDEGIQKIALVHPQMRAHYLIGS